MGINRDSDAIASIYDTPDYVNRAWWDWIGKTRLVMEVAASAREQFAHGVFFIPLATLTDANLVATKIAQTLNLQIPGSNQALLQLIDFLRPRNLLLVLDNFEQVIDATNIISESLGERTWSDDSGDKSYIVADLWRARISGNTFGIPRFRTAASEMGVSLG